MSMSDDDVEQAIRAALVVANGPMQVPSTWLRAILAEVDEARRCKAATARAVDALISRYPLHDDDKRTA